LDEINHLDRMLYEDTQIVDTDKTAEESIRQTQDKLKGRIFSGKKKMNQI